MYSSISCLQTVRNHHDRLPIIHKYTALSENWIPQKPVVYHRLSCQTGHLGGRPNFQTHPCPINIQKFPLFHRYIDLIKFHQTSHQSPLNYIKYLYQTAAKLHLGLSPGTSSPCCPAALRWKRAARGHDTFELRGRKSLMLGQTYSWSLRSHEKCR